MVSDPADVVTVLEAAGFSSIEDYEQLYDAVCHREDVSEGMLRQAVKDVLANQVRIRKAPCHVDETLRTSARRPCSTKAPFHVDETVLRRIAGCNKEAAAQHLHTLYSFNTRIISSCDSLNPSGQKETGQDQKLILIIRRKT